MLSNIEGVITSTGGRAFFVPAGFNFDKGNEMSNQEMQDYADATFEAWTEDVLDDLPNRDELREYIDGVGVYLRMATVMMLDDDKELEAKIQTEEDAETFVGFVEEIAPKIEGLNGFVETMRGASARVACAIARYELRNQAAAHGGTS